uniref:gamma-glutamylcyclotransferase n=1 Tax=Glossina palpalis gambiensis TaxID=67801 RepID=A0A1B0AXV9_9MUSC
MNTFLEFFVFSFNMASKFYYFGFGSNMLSKRIHIQNPGADRVGPGKLQDYRLDFYNNSEKWNGAPATIVPSKGDHVFGAIWEIDSCHLQDLDNQESVDRGVYTPITLPVMCITLQKYIQCRAYHLCQQPQTDIKCIPEQKIPSDRLPSETYLKTLVKGALETGIPDEYVNFLRSIKHNRNVVKTLETILELQDVKLVHTS